MYYKSASNNEPGHYYIMYNIIIGADSISSYVCKCKSQCHCVVVVEESTLGETYSRRPRGGVAASVGE